MDETTSQEDAALSLSDGGPLGRVRDPGGLESEGLTLRSGSILRGRTPHTSQMGDSEALTEFDMVTVQGQTGLCVLSHSHLDCQCSGGGPFTRITAPFTAHV